MAKIYNFPKQKQPVPPDPPDAFNGKREIIYGTRDGIFCTCFECGAGLDRLYELPNGKWECPICGNQRIP